MSRTLDTKLAMDALNMAIDHRGPPVTLHSDQGSTYATGSYREIVSRHGISEATFYNWKAKYAGMTVSEARRLKELEQENAKLKRLLAEAELDKAALKDPLHRKW